VLSPLVTDKHDFVEEDISWGEHIPRLSTDTLVRDRQLRALGACLECGRPAASSVPDMCKFCVADLRADLRARGFDPDTGALLATPNTPDMEAKNA
jgi:hypothetical protein